MNIRRPTRTTRRRSFAQALCLSAVAIATTSTVIAEETASVKRLPGRLPIVTVTAKNAVETVANKQTLKNAHAIAHRIAEPVVDEPLPQEQRAAQATNKRPTKRWLRSKTSSSAVQASQRLILEGSRDYSVGAWLSAEKTAWESLRWAAESIDLAAREAGYSAKDVQRDGATIRLQAAKTAMEEARDFSQQAGAMDTATIARIAKTHATTVLHEAPLEGLTASDAADQYLDHARVLLAPIATNSVEASRSMDLLAAVYLQRNDASTLPSATALCLRRAALQGQPGNASLASRLGFHLADVGLLEEAQWALEHSMSIEPATETAQSLVQVLRKTGRSEDAGRLMASLPKQGDAPEIQVPQIQQLTPSQFAAVSKPVMQQTEKSAVQATPVSAKLNVQSTLIAEKEATDPNAPLPPAEFDPSVIDGDVEVQPGMIRRMMGSFKKIW
ncbi:MAG: hypothetical protein AB8B91_24305 [Rubripirellula sp.]